MGEGYQPWAQPPTWRTRGSLFGSYPLTCLAGVAVPGVQNSCQHSSRDHWNTQASAPQLGIDPNRGGHPDISHDSCGNIAVISFGLCSFFPEEDVFGKEKMTLTCIFSSLVLPVKDYFNLQIWSRGDFEFISQKIEDVLPYSHYFYRYRNRNNLLFMLCTCMLQFCRRHFCLNDTCEAHLKFF